MGWPKDLVLVRHAESEGNVLTVDNRATFDIPTHKYGLTERGRQQAKITGEYLRATYGTFDVYYVSYYQRSRETMSIMYPEANLYEDPRLAEAQRGIYHFLTKAEMEVKYPEELARKDREGLYHYRPPGGENWPDIELRIHSFLGTLARDYERQRVLIVGHGHWLLLFQRLIEHFSIDEAVEMYLGKRIFANASVTHYQGTTKASIKDGLIKQRLDLIQSNFVPWEGKM